ncbi:MAG: 3'-5' exonuclease [Pirellulales bacterium]
MANQPVRYFVFDIESVADGKLVSKMKYPGQGLSPQEAVAKFRAELLEKKGSDFIPYTYQMPISVAIAKLDANFRLLDLVTLDEPKFRPPTITDHFWRGWKGYKKPTFVTFNGRSFDIPLMELAAFRYGVGVPEWFEMQARSFDQPRNRYNSKSHFDLYDVMTNYGASRFTGGLNLAANLLGKPGKMDVEGSMVQDLYDEGKLTEINDYCRCDVLDTYFVFLRVAVMTGMLTLDREQELIAETQMWLEERADKIPAFQLYLDGWGDWENPWVEDEPVAEPNESLPEHDLKENDSEIEPEPMNFEG